MSYFTRVLGRKGGTGTVLGVHVSKASPALRKHLKLPHQFGLLVEHVEPNSAAAVAKLQRFDVIHKFDDQLLVNHEQLTALVRMHKPKDSVAVTIFREGKSMQVDVVLKSGPIADQAGVDWDVSVLGQLELKNHATNPKFLNCHACHMDPHPHPFEKWKQGAL